MKWFKRILLVLLILFLPFLLAGIYVFWNRNELTTQALQALKSETGALISVKDADFNLLSSFPHFVFQLDSVEVSDSNISIHQTPVLRLERMELKSSLLSLLKGSISIESIRFRNGAIKIEKYDDSTHNFLFFNRIVDQSEKKKTETSSDGISQFHIKKLEWDHVSFDFNDVSARKRIKLVLEKVNQHFSTTDSTIQFSLLGDIQVGMLGFNLDKGSFVTNTLLQTNFKLQWNSNKKILSWDGSTFKARQHPFEVGGKLEVSKPLVLDLRIKTKGILEKDVLPMLSSHIAKKLAAFEATGPINAEAIIGGPLIPGEDPAAWVQFEGVNQKFTAHNMNQTFWLEHYKGTFTNQVDPGKLPDDKNSKLTLMHVAGNWGAYPFVVSGEISDFQNLLLQNGNLQLIFGQKQMKEICKSLPFNPIKSLGWIKAKYSGRIDDLISANKDFGIRHLHGLAYFQIKEAGWKDSDMRFQNLTMKCTVDGDSLNVDQLTGELNGNKVSASGSIAGMAAHLGSTAGPVTVNLSARSSYFDINTLISSEKKEEIRPKSKAKPTASSTSTSDYNISIRVALKADKVRFQKLDCHNLTGELNLRNNNLKLSNLNFNVGNGSIEMDAAIDGITLNRKRMSTKFMVNKVDVKQLFHGLNQFGQNVCKTENISGRLDLEGNFEGNLSKEFDLKSESMKGDFSFQLRNAELKNFKPLMDLSGFLVPKESLQDVQLATLNNTLHLRGRNLKIDEMEMPTSLATFYLQGEYDFANVLDMHILVPIHTISRKNQNDIIKRGLKEKERPAIPIRVYKKDGKVEMGIDKDRANKRFWKRVKGWTQ